MKDSEFCLTSCHPSVLQLNNDLKRLYTQQYLKCQTFFPFSRKILRTGEVYKQMLHRKAPISHPRCPNYPDPDGGVGRTAMRPSPADRYEQKKGAFRCCRWHNTSTRKYKQHVAIWKAPRQILPRHSCKASI